MVVSTTKWIYKSINIYISLQYISTHSGNIFSVLARRHPRVGGAVRCQKVGLKQVSVVQFVHF